MSSSFSTATSAAATTTNAADLEFFVQYRSSLSQSSGSSSALQLTPMPTGHTHLGIYNQGATCYLNSILQALYYDDWFRNTILALPSEDLPPILKELQRFLSSMMLSENGAVSAVDLIASFGWSKAQMFEQHDAHEFYNVLFDSLSRSYPDLETKLAAVYDGASKDLLTCPKCSFASDKVDKFVNLSVDVPDSLEEPSKTATDVESVLQTHMNPEVLDVDNMWLCSGCKEKVQATKSKVYIKIPDRLVLHLKRFRFDPISRKRRKLNTAVKLKPLLDVSKCLNTNPSDKYELTSILLHSGTAMGGHYRAFVRCRDDGVWYDFNDTLVTPLSKEEESSLFDNAAESSGVSDRYKSLIQENAYMLIYDRCNRYASSGSSSAPSVEVPAQIRAEIESLNQEYRSLRRFTEIRNAVFEFSIFLRSPKDISSGTTFEPLVEDSIACTDLTFKYGSSRGNEYRLEMAVDQGATMEAVLVKASNVFAKCGLLSSLDAAPLSEVCRLRQYNEIHPDKSGETFGSRLTAPLRTLGCFYSKPTFAKDKKESSSGCSLLMETRNSDDKPFAELNNKDMRINVVLWTDIVACPQLTFDQEKNILGISSSGLEVSESPSSTNGAVSSIVTVSSVISNYVARQEIIVPGEDKSCVSGLYSTIKAALLERGIDLKQPEKTISVIHYTERSTFEIQYNDNAKGDKEDASGAKLLRRDFGLWPGDQVIVEIITNNLPVSSEDPALITTSSSANSSSSSTSASISPAFSALRSTRSSIILSFNDPAANTAHPDYDFILETSLDSTLSQVKEQIGQALAIAPSTFHVKRSVNGVQLKDDSKSLEEYSIADRGVLHIQLGKGCIPGEHLLHFDIDSGSALGDVAVSEKLTVAQLKNLLLSTWSAQLPSDVKMIRLRDGKSSSVMRDDRVLARCLVGLSDGRKITVQVLEQPEQLGSDDILLTIRTLSYENKSMSKPLDLVLKRSHTISQLYGFALESFFPQCKGELAAVDTSAGPVNGAGVPHIAGIIEVAKYGMATVPLTLKATSKLKWNEPACLSVGEGGAWDLPVDKPPMSLRDGSIVVLRSKADYEKAKAAAKNSKAERGTSGGGEDTPPALSNSASQPNLLVVGGPNSSGQAGGGSSNISRIRAMSAQGRRNKAKQGPAEQGITIEVLAPSRGAPQADNS